MPAESCPEERPDPVGVRSRVDQARLIHLVTDMPPVVDAHDMEIAQQQWIPGCVVFDDRAKRAGIYVASYGAIGADADPAFQRWVVRSIGKRSNIFELFHEWLENIRAFDDIGLVTVERIGDLVFRAHLSLLCDVNADGDFVSSLAFDVFVSNVDSGDPRSGQ